ncbi:MAG: hypothetical protein K2Y21_05720 [Phycisphaerales bacterium]|nr:hypothetical protein [Phycisphaerales bacterium]
MNALLRWAAFALLSFTTCWCGAQVITWTGAGDNTSFTFAANWSPSVVPGPTNDCVIANGSGTIQISGTVAVRSISTTRSIIADGCVSVTLTGDLTLNNAATLTIDNGGGCAGLRFLGTSHTIRGNGGVRIVSAGLGAGGIRVGNNAVLEIDTCAFIRHENAYFGTVVPVALGNGSVLRNRGTFGVGAAATRLELTGAATFENFGRCEVASGSLAINVPWTNAGTFDISGPGSLELGGASSSLGVINRTGGTLTLTGLYTGNELAATSTTGTILLKGARIENCTLRTSPAAEIVLVSSVTLRNVALADGVRTDAVTIFLEGDLTLAPGALFRGNFDDSLRLVAQGGDCSIAGSGTLGNPEDPRDLSIRVVSGASLSIGPDVKIPIGSSTKARDLSITVETQASLTMDAPLVLTRFSQCLAAVQGTFRSRNVLSGLSDNLISVGGTGLFVNDGVIETGTKSSLVVTAPWLNQGSILANGSTVQLKGAFDSFGHIERVGGSLTVGGSHSGGPLHFPPSMGLVTFDGFVGTGTRLETDGIAPLFANGSLTLVDSELACNLVRWDRPNVGCTAFALTVRSGLRLSNATIRLPGSQCGNALRFEGTPQSLTGQGEIIVEPSSQYVGSTNWLSVSSGCELTIESGVTIRVRGNDLTMSIAQNAALITKGPVIVDDPVHTLRIDGLGRYENHAIIEILAGSVVFRSVSWTNLGQFRLSGGSLFAGGTFAGLGSVTNNGGTINLSGASGGTIEANAATGPVTLSTGVYSDVTFRASGGASFNCSGDRVTMRRCLLDGVSMFTNSTTVTIEEKMTFRNGSRLIVQGRGGSGGPVITFLGATPLLDGEGEILFDRLIAWGKIDVPPDTALTIASGITIATAADGAGTETAWISLATNAAIVNHGSIASRRPGCTLEILGAAGSTLTNHGRLDAVDGTLSIKVPNWSSPGALATSSGTLWTQGTYGPPGTFDRSGGLLLLSGTYLGTSYTTEDLKGDFGLSGVTLNGVALRAAPDHRMVFRGPVTLNACSLTGAVVHESCSTVQITGGLALDDATISFPLGPFCFGTRNFVFSGAAQSVSGSGLVLLANGAFIAQCPLVIGSGIEFVVDSGTAATTAQIVSETPGSLTLHSTCTVRSPLATLTVGGPDFVNLGVLRALAGSLAVTAKNAGFGTIDVTPGASLSLSGTFSIDKPLHFVAGASLSLQGSFSINAPISVTGGGSLTLAGTWTNNSIVSVSDGPITLSGTWTNAGTFQFNNVSWTIGGTYSSLGSYGGTGIRYTYFGTPPGNVFVADASTGDITFNNASFVNTTLRARDGAKFRCFGAISLDNCTVDGDLVTQTCAPLFVDRDLTLLNGATISLSGDPNSCYGDGLYYATKGGPGNFAIRGHGRISLERRTFDRILKLAQGTLTIEPGIEIDMPPVVFPSYTYLLVNPGAKIINQGRIRIRRGWLGQIAGDFLNQGELEFADGSTVLSGPFTNAGTLRFRPNSEGTITGVWNNLGILEADSATLTLSGTWTNTGLFDFRNTQWSLNPIPVAGWGTVTGSGNTLTLSGAITAPIIRATTGTGNISLNNVSATAIRFEAAPGVSIQFNGIGAVLTRCTIAGDASINGCATLSIRDRLTLANNAVVRVRYTCGSSAFNTSGSVTIDGAGSILADTVGTSGAFFAVGFGPTTIEPGVTIGLDPTSTANTTAQIVLQPTASLISKGTLSADRPGRTLQINSEGTLSVQGVARAQGGSIQIIALQFGNWNTSTRTLSGGRWICDSGSITFGSRVPYILGADTEVTLRGTAASFGPLWSLNRIDGTLRLDNNYLGSNPPAGVLQISGLLDLAPSSTLAIGAPITLLPGARVNIGIASLSNSGRVTSAASVALAGSLTGSFVPPYMPTASDRVESVVTAPTITGGFSSVCFAANAAGLGVTTQLRGGPPDNLDLVATNASGAAPTILTQPLDANAQPDAEFTVVAGPANSTYRWQRNGVTLADGPTAAGSTIEGSATNQIRILHAAPADAGLYRCIVENTCGSAASAPALLTVCPGDLNADGIVDDRDFNVFALAYDLVLCSDPAMPVACPADLNRDGVANDEDFMIFAVAYNATLCPS